MAVPFFLVIGLCERIAAQEPIPKPPINAAELRPDDPWPDDPFAPDPTQPRRDDDLAPASWERVGDLSSLGSLMYRSAMESASPRPFDPSKDRTYEPKDLRTYLAYAEIHRKLGNLDRALEYFSSALGCDSKNIPAGIGYVAVLWDRGNYPEAMQAIEGIIQQHQDHAAAYAIRGLIRAGIAKTNDEVAFERAG